ncbi:MAG: neutral/alkaline non-lysosomal ceramidase N-terminal domain-containing protein [Pirellulales bacterium]
MLRSFLAGLLAIAVLSIAAVPLLAADEPAAWKAGVASAVITPSQPTWMAGYAGRTKPADGTISELWAKALAVEDANGTKAVIVTADLIGIPRLLREQVAQAASEEFQLDPASLLLNCSHTHCGPVVKDDLEMSVMYQLEPEQRQRVESYFVELREKLIGLIGQSIERLQPARLGYSHARCGFAMNRRLPTRDGYQNSPYPDGPVDHDVPVLRVEDAGGKLFAVAFGYACHNTSTGIQQYNADYAGYAQTEIEKAHPGVTALFVMGCGGDQNPYPRGQIEWAQAHGRSLANAVEAALLPRPRSVRGPLKTALRHVDLPFQQVTKEALQQRLASTDSYEQRAAAAVLREAESLGHVRDHYSYPIQVLRFGGDVTLVALAGEVVIDYSLRLKLELAELLPRDSSVDEPHSAVWIAGYSNDVFAYIPSRRVLREGGYEAATAMRFTALPGPFQPQVEELIVEAVRAMVVEGDDR